MSILLVFLAVLLFGLSLLAFAQVLSTLFTDAKLASQVGPTIMMFPVAISIFIGLEAVLPLGHERTAQITLNCLYFLPWFPFQVVAFESIYNGGA